MWCCQATDREECACFEVVQLNTVARSPRSEKRLIVCVRVCERVVERQKMRRHAGQAAIVSVAAAAAWVVVVLTARSQSENTGALYF